eukprot:8168069-Pyramimonas_sp.AAC.1
MQKRSSNCSNTRAPPIRIWRFLYRHSVVGTTGVLCYAMICDAMICYATHRAHLCYAVLHYAMINDAMI